MGQAKARGAMAQFGRRVKWRHGVPVVHCRCDQSEMEMPISTPARPISGFGNPGSLCRFCNIKRP